MDLTWFIKYRFGVVIMKKIIIGVLAVFSCFAMAGVYSGGDGSVTNPYRIANSADWEELTASSGDWGDYFELTNNIDLGGVADLQPVADYVTPFTGVFDGRGFTISNAVMNFPGTNYIGLFGDISGGVIKNINVDSSDIVGKTHVGLLAGRVYEGEIINCHTSGSVAGTWSDIGGLAGSNNGMVRYCSSQAVLDNTGRGSYRIGGLIGSNDGDIEYCYALGNVTGPSSAVGGLVGSNGDSGSIRYSFAAGTVVSGSSDAGGLAGSNNAYIGNCYALGDVYGGRDRTGGLVGWNRESACIVEYCCSVGAVSGERYYVGGLVGDNDGTVTGSFWDKDTSGMTTSAGGLAKTTAQMKQAATFTAAGWDFLDDGNGTEDHWRICVDGVEYPKLSWQFTAGDIVCGEGVDIRDFAAIAKNWLTAEGDTGWYDNADVNHDGLVGEMDIIMLCENWLGGSEGL